MRQVFAILFTAFSIHCAAQSAGKAEVFSSAQIQSQFVQLASQTKASGSSGSTIGDYGTHALKLSERTVSGGAEIHAHFVDVMLVMDGKAELITGGELIGAHEGTNGEITGSGIRNGSTQQIAKGDLVHIPAGVPHQLIIAPGTTYEALVIKVKE
jgi:mannose-6-phosphate isomerase-like protein (cupin superfamily)